MFRLSILLLIFVMSPAWGSDTYTCEQHSHVLTRQVVDGRHADQWLWLDGHQLLDEFESDVWLFDDVSCTEEGFLIKATHVVDGVPSTEMFELFIDEQGDYDLL